MGANGVGDDEGESRVRLQSQQARKLAVFHDRAVRDVRCHDEHPSSEPRGECLVQSLLGVTGRQIGYVTPHRDPCSMEQTLDLTSEILTVVVPIRDEDGTVDTDCCWRHGIKLHCEFSLKVHLGSTQWAPTLAGSGDKAVELLLPPGRVDAERDLMSPALRGIEGAVTID